MNRLEIPPHASVEVLAAARETFLRNGTFAPSVPEAVRESLLRCRYKGVHPNRLDKQTSLQLTLDSAASHSRALLQAAERPLEILHGAWQNEPHMVVMADPIGVLLRVLASAAERENGRSTNMVEGATWNEGIVGTNA